MTPPSARVPEHLLAGSTFRGSHRSPTPRGSHRPPTPRGSHRPPTPRGSHRSPTPRVSHTRTKDPIGHRTRVASHAVPTAVDPHPPDTDDVHKSYTTRQHYLSGNDSTRHCDDPRRRQRRARGAPYCRGAYAPLVPPYPTRDRTVFQATSAPSWRPPRRRRDKHTHMHTTHATKTRRETDAGGHR